MGATASYKVSGKADTSPLDKLKNKLKQLNEPAKKLNDVVKEFKASFIVQGVQMAAKFLNNTTESFNAQNKAATLANKAFLNNSQLTTKSIQNIRNAMNSFSLNNLIDGDTLNNAASLASQMGLNEEQIIKVMDAATEMSSAGIMPLDQAVKTLSESYTGNISQLKKLNPELANLTAEQLKAGGAVDAMKTKYDGFRTSLSETFEGRNSQIKNQFSDLQSSIGGVVQALKFEGQALLLPKLQEITSFIEEHRNQIINFILNLPDLIGRSLSGVGQIIIRFFETIPDLGKFLFGSLAEWLPVVWEAIKSIGTVLTKFFDLTFGNLGNLFYNKVVLKIESGIQNAINGFVEKHPKIAGFFGIEKVNFDLKPEKYTTIEDAIKDINNQFKKTAEKATKASNIQSKLNDEYLENYSDITKDLTSDLSDILNRDLPEDLQKALSQGLASTKISTQASLTENEENPTSTNPTGKTEKSSFKDMVQSAGELGSVITNLVTGDYIGILVQFVGSLSSALQSVSQNFSYLINCLSTVANVTAELIAKNVNLDIILQPFVDVIADIGIILGQAISIALQVVQIFSPMFDTVAMLWNLIADIFSALSPIISILVKFLNLLLIPLKMFAVLIQNVYNVVAMVINALAPLISSFANFFIKIWNGIVDVFSFIKLPTGFYWDWGPHFTFTSLADLMGLSKSAYTQTSDFQVDTSSNANDYNASSNQTSVSSGSASYTAAKDVYVNIYFSNSFVNGDAQEIAIMLKKEIARAESKNLV